MALRSRVKERAGMANPDQNGRIFVGRGESEEYLALAGSKGAGDIGKAVVRGTLGGVMRR
jgi:hypothetical protein